MKGFLAALIVSAFLIGGFFSYMGMFSQYEITEKNIGPYKFVYQEHLGSYSQAGKVIDKIYNQLKEDGIETELGMGIYYDNPRYTPKEELKSDLGVIIKVVDYAEFAGVANKYNVKEIPITRSMVVEFPMKNDLSYALGPMKIYPMFAEYSQQNGYQYSPSSFEIYNIPENTIIFAQQIVPLDVTVASEN